MTNWTPERHKAARDACEEYFNPKGQIVYRDRRRDHNFLSASANFFRDALDEIERLQEMLKEMPRAEDMKDAAHYAGTAARIEELQAILKSYGLKEHHNSCAICARTTPCELINDANSPCSFDPTYPEALQRIEAQDKRIAELEAAAWEYMKDQGTHEIEPCGHTDCSTCNLKKVLEATNHKLAEEAKL